MSNQPYEPQDYCICPVCRHSLKRTDNGLTCNECSTVCPIQEGVPILLPTYTDDTKKEYLTCYEDIAEHDLKDSLVKNKAPSHEVLKTFIGSTHGKKVLDIGSSQALYLRELDAEFKVALDIAFPYLKSIPDTSGVAPVCADAEILPVKPGFFDVIIISDMLEHILAPENLVGRLEESALPDTRIIVHIPWEEDLAQYVDSEWKYSHLRRFNAGNFFHLFAKFRVKRRRSTYPKLDQPVFMNYEPMIPAFVFNLMLRYYFSVSCIKENRRREKWIAELPRRDWWLTKLYRPVFRIFEMRKLSPPGWFQQWIRRKIVRK